jgi:methyl-accepting chemotaxis protein
VQHTSLVENEIRQLEKLMLDAETGQRGFIFTGDEQFLEPYNQAIDQIDDTFTTLDNLIDDNPEQQARLAQINTLIDQKIAELSQTIDLKRTNQNEALMALVLSGHGKQIMDEARSILQTMLEVEETLMEQRKKSANQAANTANLIALGGTLLIIAASDLPYPPSR